MIPRRRHRVIAAVLFLAAPRVATAEAVIERAERLWDEGDLAAARTEGEAWLEACRSRLDDGGAGRALSLLGAIADSQGARVDAARLHAEARELARTTGDRALEAHILAGRGFGHWKRAEYAEALSDCLAAAAIQEEIGDGAGLARTLGYLGRTHFKQGHYDEAIALYERARVLEVRAGAARAEAETLEDLGLVWLDQHRYSVAIDLLRRALARADPVDAGLWCRIRIDEGNVHLFQGDLDAARVAFDEALARATAAGSLGLRAAALEQQGRLAGLRDDHARAAASLAEASELLERAANPRARAWVLAARAQELARLDRLAEAVEEYRLAIETWESIGDRRALAWHLHEAATCYERAGDDGRALELHRRALDLGAEIELPYRPLTLVAIGRLLARRGECGPAREAAHRAVDLARKERSLEMEWNALHGLGRVERGCGDDAAAARAWLSSLDRIDAMRPGVETDDAARVGFLERKQSVYASAVATLMDLGKAGEALEVAERARARALLDLLAERGPDDAGAGAGGRAAPLALAATKAEVRRRGATVIEYFVGDAAVFAWVIDPSGGIAGQKLPLTATDLAEQVDGMRSSLDAADGGRAALRRLHAGLVAPLRDRLPAGAGGPLLVIPHGKLMLVSFAALLDSDDRYLVERHAVGYAPSISTLAGRRRVSEESDDEGVLVVGNPAMPSVPGRKHPLPALAGAEDEARAVAATYAAQPVTLLLGDDASEQRVREVAPRSQVIHLASHGVIDHGDPLESFVALAPSTADDGRLTMAEVSSLDLDARLVVLSSCDSGLGQVTGEGVIGPARAFLAAGAENVVVSLWRVADVTARAQMEGLHRRLVAGEGLEDALRATQLETIDALRAGRFAGPDGRPIAEQPLLWAPFVVMEGGE